MSSGKLRRSWNNKIIAGVAGGMAEWMGIKSIWIRLLWVILLIPGGLPGVIPYIVCWMIIPKEEQEASL
jgi:phage shock protein PspC (stress-responsive transcriptional regulator)